MARNISHAFKKRAFHKRDNIAIQWKSDQQWIFISYGELYNKIASLSSVATNVLGVKPGDKAAFMISNRPEWPIVFFALIFAGAIPVPGDPAGSSAEAVNITRNADCVIAFTESPWDFPHIRAIHIESEEFKSYLSYPHSNNLPGFQCKRSDDACIMYTSGVTSNPKGVVLSHGNLLSNIFSLYRLGFMKDGDGIVSVLPLYHAYAMVVTTIGPLIYGGRVIYPGSIHSKEVMDAVRESHPVIFVGVPIIFEIFHKTIKGELGKMNIVMRILIKFIAEILYFIRRFTNLNIAKYFFYPVHKKIGYSIKVCMNGGARLNEHAERDLFKFGFTVLNGYGLTEASPVISVNPLSGPKIGSAGLPIANVRLKLINKDKDGVGELLVSGPNVMKGYYKNDELTRNVIQDGWLHTKDHAYIDSDGYLFLAGRASDAIVFGTGLKINPEEIEEVYSKDPMIKELCIMDIPGRKNAGDMPVLWALVVPNEDFCKANAISNLYRSLKTAIEKTSRNLSLSERIMGFSVFNAPLPRTLLGKIRRGEVRKIFLSGDFEMTKRYLEKSLAPEDIDLMRQPRVEKVISCLKECTGNSEIFPDDSFELDLGVDMIGRAEIASSLRGKLSAKITDDEINNVFTVRELIAKII